jgi:Flp pilus assembly protein protease CpaA
MRLVEILPWLAIAGFVAFAVLAATRDGPTRTGAWLFPAALSAFFCAYSFYAVMTEGPFGFWVEHTRNVWGNQIWFDLVFAIGIGWYVVMPEAKSLGMKPLPWLVLILCTGCVGFLAMIARLTYLREQSEAGVHATPAAAHQP